MKVRDLTLLYYTANKIEEKFAERVRAHLLSLFHPDPIPIISVSHKPIDFGKNICVEGFEYSIYNIYRQILIGAQAAETPFVACCEDDALYNKEHFLRRPVAQAFAYNLNRWIVDHEMFFHRNRVVMSMCIAPRDLMIKTLTKRFEKFPHLLSREELVGFGEPGRSEEKLGLPPVEMQIFESTMPTLVFNHRPSVGGVRKVLPTDVIRKELPSWGTATDLWTSMYE